MYTETSSWAAYEQLTALGIPRASKQSEIPHPIIQTDRNNFSTLTIAKLKKHIFKQANKYLLFGTLHCSGFLQNTNTVEEAAT